MKLNVSFGSLNVSLPEINIYQIYYDEKTRSILDSGFLPMDNTYAARPDWFEFWPIRNYLRQTQLKPEAWYGFLSPKFKNKTNLTSAAVKQVVSNAGWHHDVFLFSPGLEQIAYFKSIFEQGEYWHPGLMAGMQDFLDSANISIKLDEAVSYSKNSVFSNFVVARKGFWIEWLKLADALFDYFERFEKEGVAYTTYGSGSAPMKAFIQERLSSIILARGRFSVFALPIELQLQAFEEPLRRLLVACDVTKEMFVRTGDQAFLQAFKHLRRNLAFDRATAFPVIANKSRIADA